MIRKAKAVWHGAGRAGSGQLTSDSGVLDATPYSFKVRTKRSTALFGLKGTAATSSSVASILPASASPARARPSLRAGPLTVERALVVEPDALGFPLRGFKVGTP